MKKNNIVGCIVVAMCLIVPGAVFAEGEVSVHLQIETASSTLFNNVIPVSACSADASSTPTLSGYCAITQSGLENEWSTFGDDKFLSSVAGVGNDVTQNVYWGWFANLEYGQTSLLKHELSPNEHLLVTLGKMPLKISVSTTTPYVDATTTVSAFHYGFDDAWNGVWLPATTSTIKIDDTTFSVDEQGNYDIAISSTTPFTISAQEEGFIDSSTVLISPVIKSETSTTTESGSSGGGGGGTVTPHAEFSTQQAVQFLLSKQKSDGSFGSDLYTDWVAIALASAGVNNESLRSYVKNSTSATTVTDYERHSMALLALGINTYSETPTNYIQKIVDTFDGAQIGDVSLVNDDIFALFPLLKTGFSTNDDSIQKIVTFILSKQQSNGSWENSVDVTAAAIQALSMVQSLGVSTAQTQAKNYLSSHQVAGGGFGTSFSTSWSLQAITALGESSTSWNKDGVIPENALADVQQSDGGVESATTDESTRIWATSYALPAVLHKTWPMILSNFSKPSTQLVTPTPTPSPIADVAPITVLTASTTTIVEAPQPARVLPQAKKITEATASTTAGKIVEEIPAPQTQLAATYSAGENIPYVTYIIAGLCLVLAFVAVSYKIKK